MPKRLGFRILVGASYYATTAIVVAIILFVAGFAYPAVIMLGTAPIVASFGVVTLLTLSFIEAFRRKEGWQKGITSLEVAIVLIVFVVVAAAFAFTVLANRS